MKKIMKLGTVPALLTLASVVDNVDLVTQMLHLNQQVM